MSVCKDMDWPRACVHAIIVGDRDWPQARACGRERDHHHHACVCRAGIRQGLRDVAVAFQRKPGWGGCVRCSRRGSG